MVLRITSARGEDGQPLSAIGEEYPPRKAGFKQYAPDTMNDFLGKLLKQLVIDRSR